MACVFYKKGWLNENGTLNDSIRIRYDEIQGVSKNINKCLSSNFSLNEKRLKKKRNDDITGLGIGLKVLPPSELLKQLQCITFKINAGLDSCIEKILKSRDKLIR